MVWMVEAVPDSRVRADEDAADASSDANEMALSYVVQARVDDDAKIPVMEKIDQDNAVVLVDKQVPVDSVTDEVPLPSHNEDDKVPRRLSFQNDHPSSMV